VLCEISSQQVDSTSHRRLYSLETAAAALSVCSKVIVTAVSVSWHITHRRAFNSLPCDVIAAAAAAAAATNDSAATPHSDRPPAGARRYRCDAIDTSSSVRLSTITALRSSPTVTAAEELPNS